MSERVITGGCLCGGVRYAIELPLRLFIHCHCSRCRTWCGAERSAEVSTLRSNVGVTQGEALLGTYMNRSFCSRCGSSLFWGYVTDPPQDYVGIAAGTLDGDPGLKPMLHIYVGSKAPWHAITDDLPQYVTEEYGETV